MKLNTVRYVSVLCVFVMILTAFQVMSSNVRAETTTSEEQTTPLPDLNLPRQLTVSEDDVSLPQAAVTVNGTAVLAWCDTTSTGSSVETKSSNDSGRTYTGAETIGPRFSSITSLRIACDDDADGGIAIAFVARYNASDSLGVFLVVSNDNGGNWSSVTYIGTGDSVGVVMHDGAVVLGFCNPSKPAFQLIRLDAHNGTVGSALGLMSLPVADSSVALAIHDDSVLFVLSIHSERGLLVSGTISLDGTLIRQPSVVWAPPAGQVQGMVLVAGDNPSILFTWTNGVYSSIYRGTNGAGGIWSVTELVRSASVVGSISCVQYGAGHYMAWENRTADGAVVSSADVDANWNVGPVTVAAEACSEPTLLDLPGGLACFMSADTDGHREIFLAGDVAFDHMSIVRLIAWLGREDASVWFNCNETRSSLVSGLVEVLDAYYDGNDIKAIAGIDNLTAFVQGHGDRLCFNALSTRARTVQAKLFDSLALYRSDAALAIDGYLPERAPLSSAPPGSIYALTVNVDVLTMDATISWTTSVNSSGNLLYLAEGNLPYGMPMTAVNGTDYLNHSIRLNGLRPDTWYRCTVQSVLGGNYLAAQEERFYTNVSVMDVVVTPSKTTAEISWSTDSVCGCTLDYWELGSNLTISGQVMSGNGLAHHASLSDLIPGVSYGYRIVAQCDADASRTAFNASSFTTKTSFVKNVTVVVNGTGADVSWTVPTGIDCTFDRSGAEGMLMPEDVIVNGTLCSVHLSDLEPLSTCSFVITAGHGSELLESCDGSFVASRINGNGTVEGYSILHLTGGGGQNDAGQGIDAGDGFGAAMFLVPGSYNGRVISTTDTVDYYQTNLTFGQTVDLSLTPPAGSDLSLYLLNGNGYVVASSSNPGNGVAEHIHYSNTGIPGMYRIEVLYVAGASPADYELYYGLIGTTDSLVSRFSDSGDNEAIATHIEGFSVEPSSGWVGQRAPAQATFYMNLYDHTYQVHTGYVVSVRYLASTDVQLTMYDGASWVTVATLPGKSTWWTYSFKLSGSYYDVLSARAGMNVWFQLSAPIRVSAISAQAYDYQADFFTSGSEHRSGIYLESQWSISGGVANGSAGATIICSLPSSSTSFIVSFTDSSLVDGLVVKEADWVLGSLYRNGNDAVIELDRRSYRDVDPTTPNMDVRLTLLSALVNLTSLELLPASYYSDVGTANDMSSQYHAPGIWLDGNSMWGTPGSENVVGETRSYRTGGTNAYFYLTGAVNGLSYDVGILYKASSNPGYVEYCYGPSNFEAVATLATDGQWHTVHFQVATSLYYDARTDDQLDLWFWFTAAGTEVSRIYASPDSDADGFTDANEAIRFQTSSPGFSGLTMHTFDVYAYAPATFAVSFTVSYGWVYLDGVPLIGTWDVPLSPLFNLNLDPGNHQIGVSTQTCGYVINILVRNTLTTNPFSADTDSDNLNDVQEFNAGTDPRNPDTDHDGLLDGNERFSYVVSTDQFMRLAASVNTPTTLGVHLPGFAGTIDDVYVQVGVVGVSSSNLAVHVSRDGWPNVVNLAVPSGSSSLFASWNLYPTGAWARSAFTDAANWYVTIYDSSSVAGTVQYVKIQVDGHTDPLNPDSDGDGLLDGAEVNNGTCPMLADTDGDGLTDYNEIHGITPCGQPTDPLRTDTDADGYADNVDKYMGDMMLKLSILGYEPTDDVNYGSNHQFFFTVQTDGTTTFNTARFSASTNSYASPDLVYYIDASDIATSTSFFLQNWADDAGTVGDDIRMDISPVNGVMDLGFTYSYSTPLLEIWSVGDHSGEWIGGHSDADVYLTVEKVIQQHSHTIVVNGTGNNSYGLDKVGNAYRYSADDQVYVLDLICSGSDSTFCSGVNTIILPRSIAVNSLLDQYLSNPSTITSDNPLYGAAFAYTNQSAASGSGHVIAVISQSLTYQAAETLLTMLTHGPGNAVVGRGTVIEDPDMLYLMHLPIDVLRTIPMVDMQGSALGYDVNIIDIAHYIVGIAEFAFNMLVAGPNLLINFAKIMWNLGLAVVNALGQAMNAAVAAATQAVADAFNAFVAWAISFATTLFQNALGFLSNSWNSILEWGSGLVYLIKECTLSTESGNMSTNQAANSISDYILYSWLGIIISSICLVISIAMMVLAPTLAPFMFLITLLAPVILGVIVQATIPETGGLDANGNVVKSGESGLIGWLHAFYTGSDYQWLNRLEDCTFAAMDAIWEIGGARADGVVSEGLAFSIVGLIMSFASPSFGDMAIIGTVLSGMFVGYGLLSTTRELAMAGSAVSPFSKVAWSISAVSFSYYCMDLVI